MSTNWHHFVYGASRTGKTTLAAQCAKAGMRTLAVTMEPGVTRAAFIAEGAEVAVLVPALAEELFLFLDYPKEYLAKNLAGFDPQLVIFDNLQGLQTLIIGRPGETRQTIAGMEIDPKPATGIIGKIPKGSDVSNPESLSQQQYGVLGRYTRRMLTLIDSLPYSTFITATEQYDFDEKYRKDIQGKDLRTAAGRPRTVKGYPATEGSMTKQMLPACVSGAFIHLTRNDSNSKYALHTRTHEMNGVEWFADPRGLLKKLDPQIDWTGKSGAAALGLVEG